MSRFDQPETVIQKNFHKLKIKSQKSNEDTKLSTIKSISSKRKSKPRKLHLPRNTFSIRKKTRLYLSTVASWKKRKKRWTQRDKLSKTFPMRYLNFIQALNSLRLSDSIRKISMSWFLQKEISWALNLLEEMTSLLCYMKRSRFNKQP